MTVPISFKSSFDGLMVFSNSLASFCAFLMPLLKLSACSFRATASSRMTLATFQLLLDVFAQMGCHDFQCALMREIKCRSHERLGTLVLCAEFCEARHK